MHSAVPLFLTAQRAAPSARYGAGHELQRDTGSLLTVGFRRHLLGQSGLSARGSGASSAGGDTHLSA